MSKHELPHTPLSAGIDRVLARVGDGLSYLWLVLLSLLQMLLFCPNCNSLNIEIHPR